jgi:hypothetical protein
MRIGLTISLLVVAGCSHSNKPAACAPGLASQLEVRDGAGLLELAVKPSNTPGEVDLCDAQAQRVGRIATEGDTLTVMDGAGQLVARLKREGADDWTADGPKGPLFRVHQDKSETRILKPDGIPLGSVSPQAEGGTLYSPASVPVGMVKPHDKGMALQAADGATKHYVTPANSPIYAGLLAVEGLPLSAKIALFLSASKSAH